MASKFSGRFSMEDAIQRIVNDLETKTPISESGLKDLQTLLDHTLKTNDPIDIGDFYDELSSRNLSPTSLINSIASTMDSSPSSVSLLASKVYLSLLLTPNSPVFTLFTPMGFLSLLRSIRQGFKTPFSVSPDGSGSNSQGKKKKGRTRKGGRHVGDNGNESEFDVRVLFIVLERLKLVLGLVHLGRFPDCLKSLVQTVAEIAVKAVDLCGNSGVYGRFCELCNQILSEVLKVEHGDQGISAVEILKSLTPLILLVKSPARTLSLEFVVNRMMGLAKESNDIKKAVLNLPKYIVQKAPEKTEPRAAAVEAIVEIVKVMDFEDQNGFANYVVTMSQGKAQLRLLAVDLIPALMMSLKDPFGSDLEVVSSWGLSCLEVLIQRCSDATAGIRARALINLAQLVGFFSGNDKSKSVLKKFMGFDSVGNEVSDKPGSVMNNILKKRCMDEKAAVRKAALLVISKLASLSDSAPDEDFLKTLSMACSDPLVSIRKAAISALSEVNAHVKALRTLCKRKALNPQEGDSLVAKWVNQLISKASRLLDAYMSKNVEENGNAIFVTPLGCTTGKGKRTVASHSKLLPETITAVHTIGSLVIICPSANVSTIVPILHTMITSGTSNTRAKKPAVTSISIKQTAPSLYIQAWLTMGKICLTDGKLAKRYIPLFVQELEKGDCASLRNNIIVVMADFCVRYTALVDCYLSKITKCLRDPCELVRRQTFILLSRLLQRDYVKWRGVLFLRFLLSLVDESEKIRQLADFLFGNILKAKAPLLAYNSFVEAMFVLNDCNAHTGSSNPQNSRNETRIFSIRGNDEKSRSSRMHIYVTLLKQMAPEHLLATFAKICAEILAAASDSLLNIEDTTGQSVLQDAFQVLSSKEIRISTSRGLTTESADVEEEGADGGPSSAAKGRAITQAVKKSLIQNTIPIFIELKRLLESKNSPLTGSLMECLRNLLKDYKNEIDDMLIADKQLQKELIYDMQKYESMKAKSAAAEAIATMQRPDLYRSPSNPTTSSFTNKKSDEGNTKIASAMADAVAAVTARSVLREVNRGTSTPPLSAMKAPRLKSHSGGALSRGDKPPEVIESLRRRQNFDSDDDN
ncbi:uncharacterized protein LOC129883780 isoform X2 [Solanum dulcamara]|uniref:uncharacterized protein LOC129883780 isoform X2 n=1 Tax=Solanum dulcamara TaxID=45834 RepID=UPI002485692B|nr:uncharacterized protein LOC129883780 isoform X2 [Solanum dulcamara]